MKKILLRSFLFVVSCFFTVSFAVSAQYKKAPAPLRVGYSVGLTGITPEKMAYAKSVGIDCVETSFSAFIDKNRNFIISDEEIIEKLKKAKKAADDAGIEIWSIHMPFGKNIDLSLTDETERQKVVALHQKVLKFCRILQPKIILFHPSFFLGLNEREVRKSQMIKSARELNETVKDIKATMVIENMLGYELQMDTQRERPLCRTVEETVEIMNRLPKSIYSAVDMNHIKDPEKLIRAMGKRLKSVHIADGDGKKECHYFPCSGQGGNNWVEILSALRDAHYVGPFMYECAYKDVKDMKECYEFMYNKFVTFYSQTPKPIYIPASDLTLVGKILPTQNHYHRIDTVDFPALPPAVKKLLTHSAGLAVTFKTNSTAISAKWCTSNRKASSNMTAIAFEGLDLYIKKDGKWQFAGVGKPVDNCTESSLVKNMNNSEKECLLYLPLYDETSNLEIGIDSGSSIKPLADPFHKRILIYGSSILQGASASRPGMAYPSRLSRETGLNFLNLGLSGSAKMETAVTDMIAPLKADAFVLDCVPNTSPTEITERTAYMINTIRKHHPKIPIIVIQSTIRENGYFDQSIGQRIKEQNENIKYEVEKLQQSGVKDLYLILAGNLLGDDHEGTVDGTHPNDLGFDRMLQQLKPELMDILKKYDIAGE